MENINPYERKQKSQAELYQERVQKRNETEEWIFGNSLTKSGNAMPIRDNQGNIISYQKAILNNNNYSPNDFSKINNNILNNNNILSNSNYNQINLGNITNQNFLSKNFIQLQNNNLGFLGNNMKYLNENQKDQNDINYSLLNRNKITNFQSQNLPPNTPFLLILPPSSMNPIYSPINITQSLNLNNGYYPQNLYAPNLNNNYYNKNINNVGNNQIRNSNISFFGAESKKREEQKSLEMQQYRNELISQINEKRIRDEENKRKMEEENRLEDIKNLEYRLMKDRQAEEQERKLKERIRRRMQGQNISKDFERVNTSFQDASFLNNNNINNNIENNNNNDITQNDENYINLEENIYGDNILSEQDNYMKKIDADYQVLRQSINNDIDKRINDKINIINNEDIFGDINKERKINMIKKQNQLADYIMGDMHSPPTPIKSDTTKSYNIYNNPLSHSFSQKSKFPLKSYQNIQRIENIQNYTNNMLNSFKNKEVNFEDFFNRDKDENDFNVKEAIQKNEAHNKVDRDYASIFKNLKDANKYTKKYTPKNKDDIPDDNTSYSFYSADSSIKRRHRTKYKSHKMSNTGYRRSYANSSFHNTKYDKNQKMKEQDKNKDKNENKKDDNSINETIDEHSGRSTGIKNFTKTVLDKELKNIQENKEDEEDEEEDEQKDKTKQENEIENNENEVDLKDDKDENNENFEEEYEDEEREKEEDDKEEE
jgi:hypothetical protein